MHSVLAILRHLPDGERYMQIMPAELGSGAVLRRYGESPRV